MNVGHRVLGITPGNLNNPANCMFSGKEDHSDRDALPDKWVTLERKHDVDKKQQQSRRTACIPLENAKDSSCFALCL